VQEARSSANFRNERLGVSLSLDLVWAPRCAQIISYNFWIPVVWRLMSDTCTALHALNGGGQGQAVRGG